MNTTPGTTCSPRILLMLAGLLLSGPLVTLTAAGCDTAAPDGGLEVTANSGSGGSGGSDGSDGPHINWSKVGTPSFAVKIAACSESDRRVYALNQDRTIWVSRANGSDGSWTFVVDDKYVQQLFCAAGKLYVLNDDRSLWRNDGNDSAVRFVYVGKPGRAKQITGAAVYNLLETHPVIYALNDDDTLWRSTSGADDSWQRDGYLLVDTIAAGDGVLGARPFAVDSSNRLGFNNHEGSDSDWHVIADDGIWVFSGNLGARVPLDLRGAALASSGPNNLYALRPDHTLWKGTIRGTD